MASDTPTREDSQEDSPFPPVGKQWATPYGFDRCPVCGTRGIFVEEEPGECMCGAEFGGLSRTELLAVPEPGEQDVLIYASHDDVEHKVFDWNDTGSSGPAPDPRRSLAYWRVSGTPQRTGPGRFVLFSTDGEHVDYYGRICTVDEGKIWFEFLSPTKRELPADPPTRGFKYVDWGDSP